MVISTQIQDVIESQVKVDEEFRHEQQETNSAGIVAYQAFYSTIFACMVWEIDKATRSFMAVCFIALAAGLLVTLQLDKLDLHLTLNQFNRPAFDPLFLILNAGAETYGIALALFIALAWHTRVFTVMSTSLLLNLFLVQFLKRNIFPDFMRPYHFFQDDGVLSLVDGVDMLFFRAMPSGHTAAIFTMCAVFILFSRRTSMNIALILIAIGGGFARVYLSQHFMVDVFAGALVGMLCAVSGYWLVRLVWQQLAKNKIPRA